MDDYENIDDDIPDWSEQPEIMTESNVYEIELDDGTVLQIHKDEVPLMAMENRELLYQHLGYKKIKVGWDGDNPAPLTVELDDGSIEDMDGVEDTGRVFITKDAKFLADVSTKYNLVPNELIAELGQRIAKTVGATLWKDNSTPTKLYQYYLTDKQVGPNNELKVGFLLVNSVDGSSAARFQAFMFRSVCQNGMIFGKQAMGSIWARHTNGFEVRLQSWYEAALMILQRGEELGRAFERFPNIHVGTEEGQKLMKRLRESTIPNAYRPDYLKVVDTHTKEADIPDPDPGMTLWEVYNDLTANFTRPMKKDDTPRIITESTRIQIHGKLEKALLPALKIQA